MAQLLFEEHSRTDGQPWKYGEADFHFYDRIVGSEWDEFRSILNRWLSRVDRQKQENFIKKIRSSRGDQFRSILWELCLHEAFLRLGFRVERDPLVPQTGIQQPLTPDLLIERGGQRLFIEAVALNDPRADASRFHAEREVTQLINDSFRKFPDIGLLVSFEKVGLQQDLGKKELIAQIENAILEWRNGQGPGCCIYDTNGWKIMIEFQVGIFSQSEMPNQSIDVSWGLGIHRPAEQDPHDIRNAIKKKAKKYKNLDAPLIVVVLIPRMYIRDSDIPHALFGNISFTRDMLETGFLDKSWPRDSDIDGLWATRKGPSYSTISTVITVQSKLTPKETQFIGPTIRHLHPLVWRNPWSSLDISGLFPWDLRVADPTSERIEWIDGDEPKPFIEEFGGSDYS